MKLLLEEASGLRHLRFAREVLATLEAHYEHNGRLPQESRDQVLDEAVKLRARILELSKAVKAYRDFLERDRTRFRGMERIAQHLVRSSRTDDQLAEATAVRDGFAEAYRAMEEQDRTPRRQAVRASVGALRAHLLEMNDRLRTQLPASFVDSLYPDLVDSMTAVLDDGDRDDDSAASA